MGAVDFTSVSWGRTPQEAFQAAQDHALAYNGHQEGYSGTIYAKHSFHLVALPPRYRAKTFLALLEEARWLDDLEYLRDEVSRLERNLVYTASSEKRDVRRRIAAGTKEIKKLERRKDRLTRKAGPLAGLVEAAAAIYGDKNAPAVALEVSAPSEIKAFTRDPKPKRGYRLFLFTGMARS